MSYSRTAVLGLLLILILEAVLFASCFRNIYCGDSIYWLSRPGHYVIAAIRNSLRGDWISVHYEWDCLAR
jgi:hypothetical protein